VTLVTQKIIFLFKSKRTILTVLWKRKSVAYVKSDLPDNGM